MDHSPLAETTFHPFMNLPPELRIKVWKSCLPGPRIVQLRIVEQATDPQPGWYKRVRSDRDIHELEDDKLYAAPDIDDEDIKRLDAEIDGKTWTSGISPPRSTRNPRIRAPRNLDFLKPYHESQSRYSHRPNLLYGFQASTSHPNILLVCHESYTVVSRRFTKTFSSLGAVPQTWFDYKNDILYLPYRLQPTFFTMCKEKCVRDELVRVENLAIKWDELDTLRYGTGQRRKDGNRLRFILAKIQRIFPQLKRFIFVVEKYQNFAIDPTEPSYQELKFMETSVDKTGDWRLNGYRIDNAVHSFKHLPGEKLISDKMMELASSKWKQHYPHLCYNLPQIEYKVITTVLEEESLLKKAYQFEEKTQKGCWWINPNDDDDRDYIAGGGIDMEVEALLNQL